MKSLTPVCTHPAQTKPEDGYKSENDQFSKHGRHFLTGKTEETITAEAGTERFRLKQSEQKPKLEKQKAKWYLRAQTSKTWLKIKPVKL